MSKTIPDAKRLADREQYWRLAEALASLAHLVQTRITSRLDDPVGARALVALRESGPLRPTALAAQLGVSPAAVTRRIQALRRAGTVTIVPDPHDARSYSAAITDTGRANLDAVAADVAASMQAQLTSWSTEEVEAFTAMLERLLASATTNAQPSRPRSRGVAPWWREGDRSGEP